MIEKQTQCLIVKLKSDRGGEYSCAEFVRYLQEEGIQVERGPAHCPMANGVAERFNRTLIGRIRSQLFQSGLPLSLWGELALYCSVQISCIPSRSINNTSPLHLFESLTPTHTHPFSHLCLKPFGCLAFAHDRHRSSKVAPTSKRFIFVGIEPNARAWRLWDKHTQRIFVTGDAIFCENIFPAAHHSQSPSVHDDFTYPSIESTIGNETNTHTPLTEADRPVIHNKENFTPNTPSMTHHTNDDDHNTEDVLSSTNPISDSSIVPSSSSLSSTQVADPPRRSTRTAAPPV